MEEPKEKVRRIVPAARILGVQSILVAVLLLIALLLRLAGGEAFGQLKENFRAAMEDNRLMTAIISLFEDNG